MSKWIDWQVILSAIALCISNLKRYETNFHMKELEMPEDEVAAATAAAACVRISAAGG